MLRRLWIALRNTAIATAVFWLALFIVDNSGLQVPWGLAPYVVFSVVFFVGVLATRRA